MQGVDAYDASFNDEWLAGHLDLAFHYANKLEAVLCNGRCKMYISITTYMTKSKKKQSTQKSKTQVQRHQKKKKEKSPPTVYRRRYPIPLQAHRYLFIPYIRKLLQQKKKAERKIRSEADPKAFTTQPCHKVVTVLSG